MGGMVVVRSRGWRLHDWDYCPYSAPIKPVLCLGSSTLSPMLSGAVTLISLLFLENSRLVPTSGTLHFLFHPPKGSSLRNPHDSLPYFLSDLTITVRPPLAKPWKLAIPSSPLILCSTFIYFSLMHGTI